MQTKLKVGDKVLHVSGANIEGFDGMEGEIISIGKSPFGKVEYTVSFDMFGTGHCAKVLCYANPNSRRTLDLRFLNPPDGENV